MVTISLTSIIPLKIFTQANTVWVIIVLFAFQYAHVPDDNKHEGIALMDKLFIDHFTPDTNTMYPVA